MFDPENHKANLVWRNREIIDKDEEEEIGVEEEIGKTDNNITLRERNPVDI